MIRATLLGGIVLIALLPNLGGAAGRALADGFATPVVAGPPRPVPRRYAGPGYRRHGDRVRPRWTDHGVRHPYEPASVEAGLTYGWLPRNLALPIYNAPSEGPAPTL